MGFTYNPASQIVSNTRSNPGSGPGQADLYAWTGHGSGTTSTTTNGLNQLATWVSTLGHDAKGNITSDGGYTYGYSSENLLTSLTNPAGAVQTSSTYAYDPLMRLSNIDSSNAGLDAQLGYDGQEIVFEGLSDNRTRRYVFGPGVDEPLVAYLTNSSGTSRLWYQADERGSIIRLSSDSGAAGGVGKFDEYGVGTGVSRFHYTGQYWLADGNLHYFRARVLDTRLGRFLQPDPIGYGAGMNLYPYVGGDAVNRTDPLGLCGYFSHDVRYVDKNNNRKQDLGELVVSHLITRVDEGCQGDGSFGSAIEVGGPRLATGGKPNASQSASEGPRKCTRFERALQHTGEFTAGVGADVTIGGIATGTVGAVVTGAGVVTGDPPMAAVGVMVMTKGAEITAAGGTITLIGVGLQSLGGRPREAAITLLNNQVGRRLSGIPLVQSYVKQGLKKVEEYIPQFNLCE